jgi:hypothetical protein
MSRLGLRCVLIAFAGAVVVSAATARADRLPEPGPSTPAEPPADPGEPKLIGGAKHPSGPIEDGGGAETTVSHKGQLGLAARLAVGFRAIVPYDDKIYCGSTSTDTATGNAPVCIGRTPMSLDLDVSYGVGAKLEALVEVRLGLEQDFGATTSSAAGPHLLHLAPGLRWFFSESGRTKLFTTAQAVFDFTGYADTGGVGRGFDLGVRNLSGLWFDLHRNYGLYIFVGETAAFKRWLSFGLEAGVGIQGRYP